MGKSKYESHVKPNLDLIQDWREQGYTEKQIADELNVAYSSLSSYKIKYPELLEVLKKTKQKLAVRLKRTLYQECSYYETTEVHEDAEMEPVYGNDGKILRYTILKLKRKTVKKKVRPNPTLVMFAMCNLIPDEFQRVDKDVMEKIKDDLKGMTKEFTSETIKKAYHALYPDTKQKEITTNVKK